jgi:hypothetical protein
MYSSAQKPHTVSDRTEIKVMNVMAHCVLQCVIKIILSLIDLAKKHMKSHVMITDQIE